jgi:hypothetical protein
MAWRFTAGSTSLTLKTPLIEKGWNKAEALEASHVFRPAAEKGGSPDDEAVLNFGGRSQPMAEAERAPCGWATSGCPPDRAQFVALLVTSVRDDCVGRPGQRASELCLMLTIAISGLARGGPMIAGRRRPNSAASRKRSYWRVPGRADRGRRSFFNSRESGTGQGRARRR